MEKEKSFWRLHISLYPSQIHLLSGISLYCCCTLEDLCTIGLLQSPSTITPMGYPNIITLLSNPNTCTSYLTNEPQNHHSTSLANPSTITEGCQNHYSSLLVNQVKLFLW